MKQQRKRFLSVVVRLLIVNLFFTLLSIWTLADLQASGLSVYYSVAYGVFKVFIVLSIFAVDLALLVGFWLDTSDKREIASG